MSYMNYKMPRWLRSLVIVAMGILFAAVTSAVVYAVTGTEGSTGQTRAGDHNWKDVEAEGSALCQSCHFPEHNAHNPPGPTTCLDCHAPTGSEHAARVVTCRTCHGMGGGFTTQSNAPLPDPTTTTAPTTTTSSTTSTTAAPTTSTTAAPTTTTTAAPTTTTTAAPTTTTTAAP